MPDLPDVPEISKTFRDKAWFTLIDRFGLPTCFVIFICYCTLNAGRYVATEVLSPGVKAHLRTLEVFQESSAMQAAASKSQAHSIRAIAESTNRQEAAVKQTNALLESIYGAQKRAASKLEVIADKAEASGKDGTKDGT